MDIKNLDNYRGISLIGVFIMVVFGILVALFFFIPGMKYLVVLAILAAIIGFCIFSYIFTRPGTWTRDTW